jgi:hypothetical protein
MHKGTPMALAPVRASTCSVVRHPSGLTRYELARVRGSSGGDASTQNSVENAPEQQRMEGGGGGGASAWERGLARPRVLRTVCVYQHGSTTCRRWEHRHSHSTRGSECASMGAQPFVDTHAELPRTVAVAVHSRVPVRVALRLGDAEVDGTPCVCVGRRREGGTGTRARHTLCAYRRRAPRTRCRRAACSLASARHQQPCRGNRMEGGQQEETHRARQSNTPAQIMGAVQRGAQACAGAHLWRSARRASSRTAPTLCRW